MADTFLAGERLTAAKLNLAVGAGTLVAYHERTTASSGVTSATDIGVIRIDDIPVIGGQAYQIIHEWIPASTVNTDICEVQCRYTTDGTTPTTTSPILDGSALRAGTVANEHGNSRMAKYVPATDLMLSLILCLKRVSGTGTVTLTAAAPARFTTLWVIQRGPDSTISGTDL